jgi:hypothetical protein
MVTYAADAGDEYLPGWVEERERVAAGTATGLADLAAVEIRCAAAVVARRLTSNCLVQSTTSCRRIR